MRYLYIIIVCFLMLFSFIYITKENIKSVEYKSDFTLEECQNWCLKIFKGQEYVICLTGCNMKRK